MRRSGSTLQTKLVKEIISRGGEDKKYRVIKEHFLSKELRDFIAQNSTLLIYSYRDIRDVVVSDMRLFKLKNTFRRTACMSILTTMKQEYQNWNSYDNILVSRYEDFAFNISQEIRRLAKFIDIALVDDEVEDIANKYSMERQTQEISTIQYSPGKSFTFDPNSGYFKNHIGSGEVKQWQKILRPSQIALIEYYNYSWLTQMGYPISQPRRIRYFYGMIGIPMIKASQLYQWFKDTSAIRWLLRAV